MKKLFDELFLWLLIIGFTSVGAYSAYWGITQELLARSSVKWSFVIGTVTSSYIQVRHGKNGPRHSPQVKYRYKVKGEEYENSRIYFGEVASRKGEVEKIVEKYPQGRFVVVYYDPDAVATSCLEPGKYRDISSLFVIFGFILFTFGFLILLVKFVKIWMRGFTKIS